MMNHFASFQLFSCGLPQLGGDMDGFEGFLFEDIRKEMRRASRSVSAIINDGPIL